jgi:hypothetical protein
LGQIVAATDELYVSHEMVHGVFAEAVQEVVKLCSSSESIEVTIAAALKDPVRSAKISDPPSP